MWPNYRNYIKEEPTNFDYVIIVYDTYSNKFKVQLIINKSWTIIWTGESLEVAKAVRQAYCEGFNCGQYCKLPKGEN